MDDGANDILGEIRAEDFIMPNKMAVLLSLAGTMLLASQSSVQSAPLMAQSAMAKPATANANTLEVRYGGWRGGWGGGWRGGGWRGGGWGWGAGALAAGALIGGAIAAPYYYGGYDPYYYAAPYAGYGYNGYPGYYNSYAGYYAPYRPYYGWRRAYYW